LKQFLHQIKESNKGLQRKKDTNLTGKHDKFTLHTAINIYHITLQTKKRAADSTELKKHAYTGLYTDKKPTQIEDQLKLRASVNARFKKSTSRNTVHMRINKTIRHQVMLLCCRTFDVRANCRQCHKQRSPLSFSTALKKEP